MKKLLFKLILLISITGNAQAHLGNTLEEIKKLHPEKTFEIDYTTSGQKYASADMTYGTFSYYFNKETGRSEYCMQIPNNMIALNTQVEIYNRNYVIVSETSWKGYVDGGGIIKIELLYSQEHKLSYFTYKE